MPTASFRDLERICRLLNLKSKQCKNGIIYTGNVNGKWCRIIIHTHAGGRDIPTGLFIRYIKDLNLSLEDFYSILSK